MASRISKSNLTSFTSKSRHDFIEEYNKYDEPKKRELYCKISREIEVFISQGNLDLCKKLTNLLQHIGEIEDKTILEEYKTDVNNPLRNTNLVILACKYNQVDILNHILDVEKNNESITPNATDDANHNGFYYVIRSNNTNLLDMLVNRWPGNYFADDPQALDDILSQAYEELKLKNVPLSEEMEFFVESKLINLRFFSESQKKHKAALVDLKAIIERIELVIENIHVLREEYLNIESIDQKFLFIATFIAQNIHILKRQLKSTYDRLPWEEIEFCLVCYISSHTKQEEMNLFYRETLNKTKMISYLDHFAQRLEYERKNIKKIKNKGALADLPLKEREKVVENIREKYPQFTDLYRDYHSIRDIHSLQKISDYIKLALSANPNEKEGQLIITRVLQVIGEYFKNTLESPKLSITTSELLLLSLPKNTRKIVVDLRNSLSHAYTLSKRMEIQENTNTDFYRGIQNDTKKIGDGINGILFDYKLRTIRGLLKKIVDSKFIDDIYVVTEVFSTAGLDLEVPDNFVANDYEKLMTLISKLKVCIPDVSDFESKLFKQMDEIFKTCTGNILTKTQSEENFRKGFISLVALHTVCKEFKQDLLAPSYQTMKYYAKSTLRSFSSQTIESSRLEQIARITKYIINSRRSKGDSFITEEIMELTLEICYLAGPENNDIKMISELRNTMLSNRKPTEKLPTNQEITNIVKQRNNHLDKKLSLLNEVMTSNGLIGNVNKNIPAYKSNKKLQAVLEMLVLDIMSILSISKNKLEDDLFFLDSSTPMLTGKSLRNHLAHDNNLVDILFADPIMAIVLNAQKIASENLAHTVKKVGNLVVNDPSKLKERYNLSNVAISNQEKLFTALEQGRIEDVKYYIKAGADMNARCVISGWTALHFASKGPSVDCVKLVLEYNSDLSGKNKDGQTPLHIASSNGRTDIIMLLKEQETISLDERDKFGQTALHLAAKYGQKYAVIALLKNGASTRIQDKAGNSALFHAVTSKHTEIAKILLDKDSCVESNSSYTILHAASEVGVVEFVKMLIKMNSDVNCKNHDNYTPLHAAARFGHLEVVQLLVKQGADVNIKTITGVSALHLAVENGYEEVAKCLIRHGASVNSMDTIQQTVPLHFAATGGFQGIVELLLDNKADVNATNIEGQTPLHCASLSGHIAVVRLLISRGAKVHSTDKHGATPMHQAISNGNTSIVELLLSDEEQCSSVTFLSELLNIAVDKEHEDLANILIKRGANVNEKMSDGSLPLYRAAMRGNKILIDLLLNNHAEIDSKTDSNLTALHGATMYGHSGAVEVLLNHNASVHAISQLGGTPLHTAVMGGNKDVVRLLLQKNVHVNALGNMGITPLILAVEGGHKEIARLLKENGADIMSQDTMMSPLLIAVKNNDKDMVEILLSNATVEELQNCAELSLVCAIKIGNREIFEMLLKLYKGFFHINKKLSIAHGDGLTLLHYATQCGSKSIVKSLLLKGASVNAEFSFGETALCIAAIEGNFEIAHILIENGANVNTTEPPLHYAASHGHEKIVELLLSNKARVNAKDYKKRTPLQHAVANGKLNVVKILFQDKNLVLDINSRDEQDFTLLHIASDQCHLEVIKFLVDKGADIYVTNTRGSKPIHYAAREGFKSGVEFYISKGMGVDEPGMLNQTPLHYAAAMGQFEVLEYLLENGANINAKDKKGTTPLLVAVGFGFAECVKLLLKHGADYTASNAMDQKPLDIAEDKKIINILRSTENLFRAVKSNICSDVEKYIKAGAFIDARRGNGGTALHFAAWKGYDEIVRVLLQNKADPNATCKNKMTPLHYAAKSSHYTVVKTLLSNGAVYEPLSSYKGTSPSDLSNDEKVSGLFDLIRESFKLVGNSDGRVLKKIKKIDDIETVRAVMCARNRQNETLVVTAVRQNFLEIEELKSVHQGDIQHQLILIGLDFNKGDYKKALNSFRKLYERRKNILGPENPGTLDIQKLICRALYAMGSPREALETLKYISKIQIESLGMNSPDTLDTRSFIGLLLHRLENNEEALPIFREVYQKQANILGHDHDDTLDTELHMALVLHSLEKFEEALEINKKIFEKRKRKCGDSSFGAISALNNVAMVLASQGQYEEAQKIYEDVLEKKMRVFGKDHLNTIRTLDSIASLLFRQENFKGALQKYQELLKIKLNILGPNHPDTLDLQLNMGNVYLKQGKYINALKVYKDVFDKTQNLYGANSSIILKISKQMEFINEALMYQGNDTWKAIQMLRRDMNIAAQNGDVLAVENLLKNGADVNDRDECGRTPLHFAISSGNIAVVKFLLKNEADVIQCTDKGNTPLHTASNQTNEKVLDVLMDHISSDQLSKFINAKTKGSGSTALHIAAKNNAIDVVRTLLKRGAMYNVTNDQGKMPVNLATNLGVIHLLELIEEVFKQTNQGNVEIVEKLGKVEPETFVVLTNARNDLNKTLLQVAMSRGHKRLAKLMLDIMKKPSI